MKNNDYLKELHIGKMIKEVALHKHISSRILADSILLYQQNSDKIYRKADMDMKDLIKISTILECNFLEMISQKYLSDLPFRGGQRKNSSIVLAQTGHYTIKGVAENRVFSNEIHIGQYIREMAENNGWTEQDMGKRLNLTQSNVSYLYRKRGIYVKKLILISKVLNINLIAEIYLFRTSVVPSYLKFDDYTITINEQEARIKNSKDANFLMIFRREYGEK
jgi:transcriptional regulator with XRE-family HTH domain